MAASSVSPTPQLRVVRVGLEIPPDETWAALRRLAYVCAAFGNAMLTESYCKAKHKEVKFSTYTDFADKLSAGIRDAVSRECVGVWRRLGKKILRGEQTLARFSADRSLVVRDRAVRLARVENGAEIRTGSTGTETQRASGSGAETAGRGTETIRQPRIVARLRLHPRSEGEITELPLYMPALRNGNHSYGPLIERMVDGEVSIRKATLQFERPGRKIFLLLAYEVEGAEVSTPNRVARIGIDEEQLWLRDDSGHRKSLTDYLHRLTQRKRDFAGLHRRLRMSLGRRRGPGHRQQLRAALAKAGSFEEWAQGPLHQMSREIVNWCAAERVSQLEWRLGTDTEAPRETDLPWQRLRLLVDYKGAEQGLVISQPEPVKAQKRPSRKSTAADEGKPAGGEGGPERSQ